MTSLALELRITCMQYKKPFCVICTVKLDKITTIPLLYASRVDLIGCLEKSKPMTRSLGPNMPEWKDLA